MTGMLLTCAPDGTRPRLIPIAHRDELADWDRVLGRGAVTNFQSSRALARKASNDVAHDVRNVSGQNSSPSSPAEMVPPSSPHQSGAEYVDMHQPMSGRISGLPSKTEVRDKIATALKVVPSAKHVVQELASVTEEIPSVDTVEGWRGGVNIPGGYNLIVLARQFPEVRAVVRQMIDSEFDADPKAYAMFTEAMRYAQGRMK